VEALLLATDEGVFGGKKIFLQKILSIRFLLSCLDLRISINDL
jgi:hypothetical protein